MVVSSAEGMGEQELVFGYEDIDCEVKLRREICLKEKMRRDENL